MSFFNIFKGLKNNTLIEALNTLTDYQFYHKQNLLIKIMNSIEIKNLPDSIDYNFLMLTLLEYGHVLYFNDEVMGDIVTYSTQFGKLDIYKYSTKRYAYAVTGYSRVLTQKDSVILFSNSLRQPEINNIDLFANRLAHIDTLIDLNLEQIGLPFIFGTSTDTDFSIKQVMAKIFSKVPIIQLDNNVDVENTFKKFDLEVTYNAENLQNLKRLVLNEFNSHYGINNTSIMKKERLNTDEVNVNNEEIEIHRSNRLSELQRGFDRVNKMFKTNIQVYFKGGEDYGTLHNGITGSNEN